MRVEQRPQHLKHLVSSADRGELAPAAFQRPYVWEKNDVLLFVDSLLKRYPIGSFMLWTPPTTVSLSEAGRERLGPIALRPAPGGRAQLLLDGQNRLASMAWLLRDVKKELPTDLTDHERSVWLSDEEIVLNLGEQKVEFVSPADAAREFRMPVNALIRKNFANRLFRERQETVWAGYSLPEIHAGERWLTKVQDAFTEAEATVTHLEGATVQEAHDAFLHICRSGVMMSIEDFERAARWVTETPQG